MQFSAPPPDTDPAKAPRLSAGKASEAAIQRRLPQLLQTLKKQVIIQPKSKLVMYTNPCSLDTRAVSPQRIHRGMRRVAGTAPARKWVTETGLSSQLKPLH